MAAAGRPDFLTRPSPPLCTVLIAAPDLLPALKARVAAGGGEVIAFTDAETLSALDVIASRHPDVVSLGRLFATTSRGVALISRLRADPRLQGSEVRVVSEDGEPLAAPVSPGQPPPSDAGPTVPAAREAVDEQGTRRTPRVVVSTKVDVLIDGSPATLVDLSSVGVQVMSPSVLRPSQRVRVVIADESTTVRTSGTIAWATFEIVAGSGPRYRAGIEFPGSDSAFQAFCLRHKV